MKTHILLTIALVVYLTLAIITVAKLDLLDPLENIVPFFGTHSWIRPTIRFLIFLLSQA